MNKTEQFIKMLSDVVERQDTKHDADFSTVGPDFVYEFYDQMEREAPKTNDLIQTGDVVDHMDGWLTGEGTPEYYANLKADLSEIQSTYIAETKATKHS
ncbi:MAG: hypothetical protein LKI92_01970 [Schleiferilactobacillus harbinensis]|nr:hypothetical protein [Schleiferilactobacillus harbinensis]MCI1913479.1 hypothetical protein [Schleiferilactobacillus harbinensis]